MYALKTRKIGNSVCIILPKEFLNHFHVHEGDTMFGTTTPDGMQITPYDPDFADAMEAFERGRRKYRNALRELAK